MNLFLKSLCLYSLQLRNVILLAGCSLNHKVFILHLRFYTLYEKLCCINHNLRSKILKNYFAGIWVAWNSLIVFTLNFNKLIFNFW